MRHPRRAAEFASAGADTADASSLLSDSDLLHFNTHMKVIGQDTNQLAEIDTSLCDVVEDGLVAVALKLHIADLHIQPQFSGDLSGADHGLMFSRLSFFPAL